MLWDEDEALVVAAGRHLRQLYKRLECSRSSARGQYRQSASSAPDKNPLDPADFRQFSLPAERNLGGWGDFYGTACVSAS